MSGEAGDHMCPTEATRISTWNKKYLQERSLETHSMPIHLGDVTRMSWISMKMNKYVWNAVWNGYEHSQIIKLISSWNMTHLISLHGRASRGRNLDILSFHHQTEGIVYQSNFIPWNKMLWHFRNAYICQYQIPWEKIYHKRTFYLLLQSICLHWDQVLPTEKYKN